MLRADRDENRIGRSGGLERAIRKNRAVRRERKRPDAMRHDVHPVAAGSERVDDARHAGGRGVVSDEQCDAANIGDRHPAFPVPATAARSNAISHPLLTARCQERLLR
ncbi:hypothetical protein WPS_02450 [Vulcanimicrobium alpinum]|uniref:Uncharacterized protein n=1 Tax=Vulcanimicrobium alpinum TaxID=3016050 RepID=A0AAN1XSL2_UNVUL|nr:hypothetical protein WPS_02450 [Vulcanimicrobium alpinum]